MRVHVAILLGLAAKVLFGFIMISDNSITAWAAAAKYNAKMACEPCYQVGRRIHSAVVVPNEILTWHFYGLVGGILLLEWSQPVYPRSRIFAPSFLHDSLWFLFDALFVGILLPIYRGALVGPISALCKSILSRHGR